MVSIFFNILLFGIHFFIIEDRSEFEKIKIKNISLGLYIRFILCILLYRYLKQYEKNCFVYEMY